MKSKFHLLAIAGFVLFSACKDKNADSAENTTDTTSTTTVTTGTTDNAMVVEAPEKVRTAFETKYPKATNIRWQYHRPDVADIDWDWSGWTGLDDKDYAVSYNWEGNDYWAWYDEDGNWIGTINAVSDPNSLPAPINTTIQKEYSGSKVVSVDRENDKNRTAYEIDLDNGAKLLVDENGKILKKKDPTTDTKTKVNPKDSI